MTPSKTVMKLGWKKGLDTQNEVFGDEDFEAFRDLTNYLVEPGGTLVPRPPVTAEGVVGDLSQGLLYNQGTFYTFAKYGDFAGAQTFAKVLYFDPPEYTSAWVLLDQGVHQTIPYAIIRHTYTSSVFASRVFLHYFDKRSGLPTYVRDPFAPADWGPKGLPVDSYGVSTPTTTNWTDYTPVSTQAASRIFMSGVDGNAHYSGIGRGRVWNPYDALTLEKVGLPYYFYGRNDPVTVNAFVIPVDIANLTASINKYASYVVEKLNTNGSWVKIPELSYSLGYKPSWVNGIGDPVFTALGVPANGFFTVTGTTTTYAYGGTVNTSTFYLPQDSGSLYRVRLNVLPEITIVSGATLNPDAATVVGAGVITYEGVSYASTALLKASLSNSTTYYVGVRMIAGVATGYAWPITDTTISTAGSNRYGFYILATVAVDGAGNLTTTAFQYPNIKNEAWYTTLHLNNLVNIAGTGETGFLNTSANDTSGNLITTMQAVKNRLVVCYKQDTQLWAVDAVAANNAFIDRYDFGTQYQTALFYNRPVICTQRGVRAFDLTGLNFQSLDDLNIGKDIENLGTIAPIATTFWPWFGSYVIFCSLTGSEDWAVEAKLPADCALAQPGVKYGFLILSYSKEAEVAAWSWCPVDGLVDMHFRITPVDDKLYFRTNNKIYALSAKLASTVDALTATAFRARWLTQFAHLARPGTMKRGISANVFGTGVMTLQRFQNPWQIGAEAENGPRIDGFTLGKRKIPLSWTGAAISLMGTSTTGARVLGFTVDYIPLGK